MSTLTNDPSDERFYNDNDELKVLNNFKRIWPSNKITELLNKEVPIEIYFAACYGHVEILKYITKNNDNLPDDILTRFLDNQYRSQIRGSIITIHPPNDTDTQKRRDKTFDWLIHKVDINYVAEGQFGFNNNIIMTTLLTNKETYLRKLLLHKDIIIQEEFLRRFWSKLQSGHIHFDTFDILIEEHKQRHLITDSDFLGNVFRFFGYEIHESELRDMLKIFKSETWKKDDDTILSIIEDHINKYGTDVLTGFNDYLLKKAGEQNKKNIFSRLLKLPFVALDLNVAKHLSRFNDKEIFNNYLQIHGEGNLKEVGVLLARAQDSNFLPDIIKDSKFTKTDKIEILKSLINSTNLRFEKRQENIKRYKIAIQSVIMADPSLARSRMRKTEKETLTKIIGGDEGLRQLIKFGDLNNGLILMKIFGKFTL